MMQSSAFDDNSGGRTPPPTLASADTSSAHVIREGPYGNDEMQELRSDSESVSVPIFSQKDVHSEIASISFQNTIVEEFSKNGIGLNTVEVSRDSLPASGIENEHGRTINIVRPIVNMNYNNEITASVSSIPLHDSGGANIDGESEGLRPQGSVKVEDALNYLDQVKYRFSHQPEIYSSFLDIMKEFKSQTIGTLCVMDRVSGLFHGHPDLITGFNVFLPEDNKFPSIPTPPVQQYQNVNVSFARLTPTHCTPTAVCDQRYRDPVTLVIHDRPILPNQGGPIPILGSFTNSNNNIATTSPRVIYHPTSQRILPMINETLPGSSTFHQQISPYLEQAEAVIANNNQDMEYQQAINYVNTIKQRLTPEQYRQFLEILHGYQKQQRRTSESPNSECKVNDWDIYLKISKLFEEHLDLLQEFVKYVPASCNVIRPIISTKLGNKRHSAQSSARVPKKGKGSERSRTSMQQAGEAHQGSSNASSLQSATKKSADNGKVANKKTRTSVQIESITSDRLGFNCFANFLTAVQKLLLPAQYENFLRVLLLYNKEVISHSELLRTAGDLLHKDREVFKWFKMYICTSSSDDDDDGDSKSSNHIDQPDTLTDNSNNQEIVLEMDTSTCRRLGQSYCLAPKDYQPPKCSGRTPLCDEVLNDDWLSVPVWTGTAGCVTKKMPYEESMSRIEDERFECDFLIQTNTEAMMYLEVVNQRMNEMSEEERENFQLDDCLGSRSTIHLRAVRRIYGEDASPKIIEGLKRCPFVAVPIVLKRLKQKDEEWRAAQKESNKIWNEQMERYYSKSLDHVRRPQSQTSG